YRRLSAGGSNGVQSRDERRLPAFLIDGAPADDRRSQARLLNQGGRPGRRRPLGRVHLFDVIHEIKTESARGARIQCGEDTRLAVGGNFRYLAESGFTQEAHRKVATLGYALVLSRDRRLLDPLL